MEKAVIAHKMLGLKLENWDPENVDVCGERELELAYIADRYLDGEPRVFVFKTRYNDYYFVDKDMHHVLFMGSRLSDLLQWEVPLRDDYKKAVDTQKWLENKLDSRDTKDISIHIMGSELLKKYGGEESNIKFIY